MTFVFGVIKDAKELIPNTIFLFAVIVQVLTWIRHVINAKKGMMIMKRQREWPPQTDEDCYLEIKKGFDLEKNGLAIAALIAYSILFLGLMLGLFLKS